MKSIWGWYVLLFVEMLFYQITTCSNRSVSVTHNSRFRQFIIVDSRGITTWSYESVYNTGIY